MAHRHYGVRRRTKPPANDTAQAPGSVWSGSAIIAGVVVLLIVLAVVIYGVTKTVTDVANTTTSAPRTTGQGSQHPQVLLAAGLRGSSQSDARASGILFASREGFSAAGRRNAWLDHRCRRPKTCTGADIAVISNA
jgi:hypothetical protein